MSGNLCTFCCLYLLRVFHQAATARCWSQWQLVLVPQAHPPPLASVAPLLLSATVDLTENWMLRGIRMPARMRREKGNEFSVFTHRGGHTLSETSSRTMPLLNSANCKTFQLWSVSNKTQQRPSQLQHLSVSIVDNCINICTVQRC